MPTPTGRTTINSTDSAILQHLRINGAQSVKQICTAIAMRLGVSHSTIQNSLYTLGRLVNVDTSAREYIYSLSSTGHYAAQHGHRPQRAPAHHLAGVGNMVADHTRTHYCPRRDHVGDTITIRPGSQVAYTLPSRIGHLLRWPDGRTTRLDGGPLAEAI